MTQGLLSASLGAQLLGVSVKCAGTLLYRSPLVPDAAKPVRGGVPVLFPQFASTGSLRKHGFARDVPWEQTSATPNTLAYRCDVLPLQHDAWPHAAQLTLQVESGAKGFVMTFGVRNTGDSAFIWTGGLHPYWRVDDALLAQLTGLNGHSVLTFNGDGMEQLFDNCGMLVLHAGLHTLRLQAQGFDQWMVWNPGAQGARALPDLPGEDWRSFVCIEPVVVERPVRLQPGGIFSGRLVCDVV